MEDDMKCKYNGRKLAHPATICRRLISWPFLQCARCLLFLAVLSGWGYYHARRVWSDTE